MFSYLKESGKQQTTRSSATVFEQRNVGDQVIQSMFLSSQETTFMLIP